MRILHVVPTYVPAWRHGGPIRAVHGLARALVARGHAVDVFTTNVHGDGLLDVPTDRRVAVDGVSVRYFPVAFPRRLYRSPALGRALREGVGGYDLVHLHSLFLWPTLASARAAERSGVPYVVSPRGMLVRDLVARRGRLRKTLWLRAFEGHTLAHARALVVTSALEAQDARAFGIPLPPIVEVPNGIDVAEFAERSEAPSPSVAEALARAPLVLYLGRLSWKKGLDVLVAAMQDAPGATLAIAGNDDENVRPALERLASERGLGARVLFLGAVDGADKVALLRGAAALALPSRSENFGNVVLEAMAVGCPVAVTPEVGLAPAVHESGCGIVATRPDFASGSWPCWPTTHSVPG
jgi:glycosyltransferase involved in cell wall biosynthesis